MIKIYLINPIEFEIHNFILNYLRDIVLLNGIKYEFYEPSLYNLFSTCIIRNLK